MRARKSKGLSSRSVAIAGDPDHPANFGRLCSKGSALGETLGLATRLMQRALAVARVRGDAGIHLAVDQANTPAVRLYQHLGFRATARKLAMIYVLK